MRNKIMAYYLRDPRASLFNKMIEEGTSSKPVYSNAEGIARLGNAALGAFMSKKLKGEYDQQNDAANIERTNAIRLAMGMPAQTETTGDTTINWNAQAPNSQAAINALQSPYNEDLQATLLSNQNQQQQTSAQQAFQQQQQEKLFNQQKELADLTAKRQIGLEQFKMQNDPQRIALARLMANLGQQQPTNQQAGQAPTLGQAGIQPQPPQQQQIDPMATYALTGKFPEGFGLDAQGNPVMQPKTTDEQAKALGYGKRMLSSNEIITSPEVTSAATSMEQKIKSAVPIFGNEIVSPEYQNFDQASRDFINAVLRRESGAVISPSEYENAKLQYFPQYGDKPDVLAQKEKNRLMAIQSILQAGGQQGQKINIPQPKTNTNKVRVVSPEGRVGLIDQSELSQAIANGWRQQ